MAKEETWENESEGKSVWNRRKMHSNTIRDGMILVNKFE